MRVGPTSTPVLATITGRGELVLITIVPKALPKTWQRSNEVVSNTIRLDELRACVEIDLPQRRLAAIDKAARRVRRSDNGVARIQFACFVADCYFRGAFECQRDFRLCSGGP